MDKDPIRRPCASVSGSTGEDVCQADGTAGFLLPVVLPPEYVRNEHPSTGEARACRPGKFVWKTAPYATRPLCEDGSTPAWGRCLVPHNGYCSEDGTTPCGTDDHCVETCVFRAGCVNSTTNGSGRTPWFCEDKTTPCNTTLDCAGIGTETCNMIDTRVFNRVLRDAEPHGGDYQTGGQLVLDESGKDTSNTWYRIQELHTSGAGYSQPCQEYSSTRQIGCLVQASGCSMGYAGMEAGMSIPGSYGLWIDNVEATIPHIRNWETGGSPAYPFTRYLWVGTLVGFDSVANPYEDDLQGCFHDRYKIDLAAMAAGYVPITADSSDGYLFPDDKCR